MNTTSQTTVITCPIHTGQPIQSVDADIKAEKQLYCFYCLINVKNSKSIAKSLRTLDQFLEEAAAALHSKNEDNMKSTLDHSSEYDEILSKKGEHLEFLTDHIEEEKKKIADIFADLKKIVIQKIDQKEQESFKALDKQLVIMKEHYETFEKSLPKLEKEAKQPPRTLEELKKQLSETNNFDQLVTLVEDIKVDMYQAKSSPYYDWEIKDSKTQTRELSIAVLDLEKRAPTIKREDNIFLPQQAIASIIDSSVPKIYQLINTIPEDLVQYSLSVNYPETQIMTPQSWMQVINMLSPKYGLPLNLLFRGSVDGMNKEAFHSKCDGIDRTLILVKCKFQDSSKTSLIGGFLDKAWNNQSLGITSSDAFVFSITKKKRCMVIYSDEAAYGNPNGGPYFGNGDLSLFDGDENESFVNPTKYQDSVQIIESEAYQGNGRLLFTPEEVDVYQVSKLF